MSKLKFNPCKHCKEDPTGGFYAGDYAVECDSCRVSISRHFIDYPHKNFQTSARLTREAAIQAWNTINPITKLKGHERGTQFEAQ